MSGGKVPLAVVGVEPMVCGKSPSVSGSNEKHPLAVSLLSENHWGSALSGGEVLCTLDKIFFTFPQLRVVTHPRSPPLPSFSLLLPLWNGLSTGGVPHTWTANFLLMNLFCLN